MSKDFLVPNKLNINKILGMVDDRVVMVSSSGYKNLIKSDNGQGLHWTCNIHEELPIKMRAAGVGSERPLTMC